MKKNITINLLGRLYAIDEDAYELLKRYTDSLRSYFGRREGGEEIVDDIEARIAELFDELKQGGIEAITIEHVEDIIHRIGEPGEMESPSSDSPHGEEGFSSQFTDNDESLSPTGRDGEGPGSGSSRRLYRNMSDRKFMGVLSGVAAYVGGDVLWWRLGYVLLFFLSTRVAFWPWGWHWSLNASLIIIYIVMAILMPVAETPEDRLRMKGKKVTPQNLADEVSQPQPANVPGDGPKGCINGIFLLIGNLFRGFIYITGISLAIGLLAAIIGMLAVMFMPHSLIHESDPEFWQFFDDNNRLIAVGSIAVLIALVIPAYCIIHSLFHEFGKLQPMGFRQRVSFLIVWLLALVTAAVIGTGLVGKAKLFAESWSEIRSKEFRERNTHDGIFYQPYEWDFLSERGWRVLRADNCHDRYTTEGQYYGEDPWSRYIDTYDQRHRQIFTIERTDSLQPGHYQLTACGRAEGQGAYIYYHYMNSKGHTTVAMKEIPADGNTGGGIWEEARARKDSSDAYVTPDPEKARPADYDRIKAIAEANDGKGYGWNRISIPVFEIKEPVRLHYGVTTDPGLTHSTWLGLWFSACDFELKRIE